MPCTSAAVSWDIDLFFKKEIRSAPKSIIGILTPLTASTNELLPPVIYSQGRGI